MNAKNDQVKNRSIIAIVAILLFLMSATPSFAEDEEMSECEGLTLVCIGRGKMDVTEEGSVTCTPEEGWEIVSITADSEVEGIEAGEQIPETEITNMPFEDGTTVTTVFDWICDDCVCTSMPDSAGAIF